MHSKASKWIIMDWNLRREIEIGEENQQTNELLI